MLERNWSEAEMSGYIVISPAAPSNNLFFERGGDRIFPDFLDQMLREYKIEGGKFHVAGPSNGGLSAFHIASVYPQYFRSVTGFPGYLREESEARINALKPLCIYMHVGERDLEWQAPMQRQSELLGNVVAESDVVVTAAVIPGKKPPVLITREMVRRMAPGSAPVRDRMRLRASGRAL